MIEQVPMEVNWPLEKSLADFTLQSDIGPVIKLEMDHGKCLQARASPCERVRVAGQAGPRDFTGPSGGHDLKLNAPARAKMHGLGAKFH